MKLLLLVFAAILCLGNVRNTGNVCVKNITQKLILQAILLSSLSGIPSLAQLAASPLAVDPVTSLIVLKLQSKINSFPPGLI